jgi:hypothetical protein
MNLRYCKSCEEWKENSQFSKCSARKDKLQLKCKSCSRRISKNFRDSNPEKVLKNNLNFKIRNPNYAKEWAQAHKSRRSLQVRQWYKKNKALKSAQNKNWKASNPEAVKIYKQKRLLCERRATINKLQSRALKIFKLSSKEGYVTDHIIPLVHPKVCGLHVLENLQHLTDYENSVKGTSFDGTYDNNGWRRYLEIVP